jgi:hypothetical protein
MSKRLLVWSLAILLPVTLLAHGGATHLIGTVTALDGSHVTIKDKAGKSITVTLTKTTKYLKDDKPVASGELQVGSRVVIDAKMDDATKTYTAEEVRVGTASAATAKQETAKAAAQKATPHK